MLSMLNEVRMRLLRELSMLPSMSYWQKMTGLTRQA